MDAAADRPGSESVTHTDADELRIPVSLPPIDPLVTAPLGPSSFVRLLQCFGPAAIAASVSIGAGETILVVRAGRGPPIN